MATQIAVTSLTGHGSPLGAPAGAFVTSADTILSGAGATAVAMAIGATRPCPSALPTHAHVRDAEWVKAVGLDNVFSVRQAKQRSPIGLM